MPKQVQAAMNWVRAHPDKVVALPDRPETFAVRNVEVARETVGLLKDRSVIEAAGETTFTETRANGVTVTRRRQLWRLTKAAQRAKERYCEPSENKVMPCDCVKDAWVNTGEGYRCQVCERVFDREELNT